MSLIDFEKYLDCGETEGWPNEVIGDGFIRLTLWQTDGDSAIYRDQFLDEYEFIGRDSGTWTVEVREDG